MRVRRGPKIPTFDFSGKIESTRSLFGAGWLRSGREEVKGNTIEPGTASGGPSRIKNGPL